MENINENRPRFSPNLPNESIGQTKPSRGGKTLWVVLIILIILAVFGVYYNRQNVWKNISLAAVSVTSLFSQKESINVASSENFVESGEEFTITYEHRGKKNNREGFYSLSYECQNGLFLKIKKENKKESLFCNLPFDLSDFGTTTEFSLTPILSNGKLASTSISISFIELDSTSDEETAKVVKGETQIEVIKSISTANTGIKENNPVSRSAGPKTEKTYKIETKLPDTINPPKIPTGPTSQSEGVDLEVKILAVGIIDPTTKDFVSTTTPRASDRIAIRFAVDNIGNKISKDWNFGASLPTFPWHIFQSDIQKALAPGDRMEFTLGFDKIEKANGNIFTVNIDPNNTQNEKNRANNTASTTINGVVF